MPQRRPFRYVANFNSSDISQFDIAVDGSLSRMAVPSVPAGGVNPTGMAVDPTGRYAYVANDGGTVSQFAIGANGALSAMVPASVVAGIRPTGVTVDPTGRYVYVSNDFGTVSQYIIGPTGGLVAMAPANVKGVTTVICPASAKSIKPWHIVASS